VYAQHGHRLMRLKSSVRESRYLASRIAKVLAEGKGVAARRSLEEAGVQSCEPTNRNVIIRPSLWVRQHNMPKPWIQEIR